MTGRKLSKDLTIEPHTDGDVVVWEHGEYPRGSVLAGQTRRSWVECFSTVEEALKEYPKAEVRTSTTGDPFARIYDDNPTPQTPPDWFDPMDAGEVWGENDY